MRNVVLYIAVSVDGYIADKEGSVSWIEGDGSDKLSPGTYDKFIAGVDTVILGYTTYNQIVTELSPDNWVYDGLNCYVLTHKRVETTNRNIVFTDEELPSLIKRLKSTPGKDIWICGGASIVNQLMSHGLIDYYTITVVPTFLGKGVKLFTEHDNQIKLETVSVTSYNGFVETTYRAM
ncbi:MAG: dihydrofolate reductase family protein [Bacteroidales bacterium]